MWASDPFLAKGVVNRFDPRFIPDESAAELLNVDLTDPGRPCRRDGYSRLPANTSGMPDLRISALGYLDVSPTQRLLVAACAGTPGGGIFTRTSADGATAWIEATTDSGGSLDVVADRCKMFQANYNLWILPDSSQNVHALTSASRLIDLGDSDSSPPKGAADMAYMASRSWVLSGTAIYYSKLLPTESDLDGTSGAALFDRSLDRIILSPPFGGVPIAVVPWNGTSLIVFYDKAIQEILVDFDDPASSQIRVIDPRYGCSSRESIVSIGRNLYFQDQYGAYRSLLQDQVEAQNRGVIATPISEPVDAAIPNSLSAGYYSRTLAVIDEEFIRLFVATNGASDINACWNFDTVRQSWHGPYEFADQFSYVIPSDIRGKGMVELYAANNSTSDPAVYRLNDGSYTDDGVAIEYRETSKAYVFGDIMREKMPRYLEVSFAGGADVVVNAWVRVTEDDLWANKVMHQGVISSDGDFPILEAGEPNPDGETQFPLFELGESGTQFPLVETVAFVTRGYRHLEPPEAGVFPWSGLPTPSQDFPLLGAGGGLEAGRIVQYRISEATAGQPFERVGVRLGVVVEPLRLDG